MIASKTAQFQALQNWIQAELGALNTAIEAGRPIEQFFSAVQPWVASFREAIQPAIHELDQHDARVAIQLITFIVNSAERHFQALRMPPGLALQQFGSLEGLLVQLGARAEHPPVATHYTYWLWNSVPLLFTGDPQEIHFHRVVNATHNLHNYSRILLRPICEGNVDVTSPEAMCAIRQTTENMKELCRHFNSLTEMNGSSWVFQPAFFMKRMRTYLVSYPVCRVDWSGVNAANLAAQMAIDYMVGITTEKYRTTVHERLRYLTAEDRIGLEQDMMMPSLTDRILKKMNLNLCRLETLTRSSLGELLLHQPVDVLNSLVALEGLIAAAGRLTSIHWRLIVDYLVKPASQLTPEELANLSVCPLNGTGNMSHSETMAIRDMRRKHPQIGKLCEAVAEYRRSLSATDDKCAGQPAISAESEGAHAR
ncbi:MAG TPA: hypothetical protein VKZ53_22945 [Candidatus Angelobacter sp.]|nr:hypothetical protein [Candidatus Angelobacter sp.]